MNSQTNPTPMSTAEVLDQLPAGYTAFSGLLGEFRRSVPADAPDAMRAMLDRVFIAGAGAVMSQFHLAFSSDTTAGGDPSEVIAVANAMGVGVMEAQVAAEVEAEYLSAEASKPARKIIRINQTH